MERSRWIQATGPMTWVTVPDDLLSLIDVFTGRCNGPVEALERRAFRQIAGMPNHTHPRFYARLGNTIQIRGQVNPGDSVLLHYYGQVSPFTSADSSNELSMVCPDVLVYGALKFAGDHFDHPNTPAWEQTYSNLLTQIQANAVELENTGGPAAVQPLYIGHW